MNALTQFTISGTLARFLATVFLFCIVLGSAVILCIEILLNQPLNSYAVSFVSVGLSYSLVLLGIHLGNTGTTTGGIPS